MGKRAFSAKAKREQLRVKRAAAESTPASSLSPASPSAGNCSALSAAGASTHPASTPHARPRPARASRGTRGQAHKYRLKFVADSDAARAAARELAFLPVVHQGPVGEAVLASASLRSLGVRDVRPSEAPECSGPRRPPWSYGEEVSTLEAREERCFLEWVAKVQSDDLDVAFFEQNLETWRQLWRVVERSDVLVIVADIRYPALHFVPGLYTYVAKELGKGVVLALNKCDLVSADLLDAWKAYFSTEFSDLAVALFSCFPDHKLAPSRDNSELLSKRERRMARTRLAAWGADQLLAAIGTLELSPLKKTYLDQWRARLAVPSPGGSADDDEEGRSAAGAAEYASLKRLEEADERERDKDQVSDAYVTIGVIGHPNAGKSSLINGVFGRKVVSTSRTPGHTKHLQTMFLSPQVRLCDCPGLVFPGNVSRELQVLAGMYPVAQLREPYAVIKFLADRVPLVSILDLELEAARLAVENEDPFPGPAGWTAWTICEAWAHKRGFRTAKAARLDVFRAANNILRLALDGRIVLATAPPGYEAPTGNLGSAVPQASTVLGTAGSGAGGGDSEDSASSSETGPEDGPREADGRHNMFALLG
jgi:ribosome biogenesis GTPase A